MRMKNIYTQIRFIAVFTILFLSSLNIFAQPARVEGNFGAGWANYDLIDRGTVKAVTVEATATNFTCGFLFNNSAGSYNPKWAASSLSVKSFDTYYAGGAIYNGGSDLQIAIESGKFYTFIVYGMEAASTADRSMSVLQTSFIPVSVNSVSQSPAVDVSSTESVDVTATLSAAKNVLEKVFVRYTTDDWATSNFVEITSFDGSFQGTATIPAQAAEKVVEYYVLTTKEASPSSSNIDYLSLNLNNNSLANYTYTVVADPSAPTISIADDGTITEGAENGEVITVTLTNDVFESTLTPANWTVTNLPTGVTVGAIARVSDTQATITLSGNSTVDYDVNITNLTVEISHSEFVTIALGTVSDNSGVTFTAVVEVVTTPIWMHLLTSSNFEHFVGETPSYKIDVEVGQQDWNSFQVGYGLSNSDVSAWTFVDAVWYADGDFPNKKVTADITVPDVEGTYYYVARVKANPADAWSYANNASWNDTLGFAPEYTITVKPVVLTATISIADDGTITEGAENGEVITVTLTNDVFEAVLTPANWTITNLPAGVTAAIARVSDTQATITLSGNSTVDYDINITNLTVEISHSEFVTLATGTVSDNSGVTFTAVVETPAIWMHMLTSDNFTHKIGENIAYWINAEIGQATWETAQIGYGTSSTDTTGWTWLNATWYADGTGTNKQVHAEVLVPNVIDTYYYVARAKALPTDDWTYGNTIDWTDGQSLAAQYTIIVSDLTTVSDIEFSENFSLSVFPNPVENNLNLKFDFENNSNLAICVRDILGKEIYSNSINNVFGNYSQSIDVSKFSNGTYILEIISNNEKISKLIIKK